MKKPPIEMFAFDCVNSGNLDNYTSNNGIVSFSDKSDHFQYFDYGFYYLFFLLVYFHLLLRLIGVYVILCANFALYKYIYVTFQYLFTLYYIALNLPKWLWVVCFGDANFENYVHGLVTQEYVHFFF